MRFPNPVLITFLLVLGSGCGGSSKIELREMPPRMINATAPPLRGLTVFINNVAMGGDNLTSDIARRDRVAEHWKLLCTASFTEAGFKVVVDPQAPHELRALFSADYNQNNPTLVMNLKLDGATTLVATAQRDNSHITTYDYRGTAEQYEAWIMSELVNEITKSPALLAFAEQQPTTGKLTTAKTEPPASPLSTPALSKNSHSNNPVVAVFDIKDATKKFQSDTLDQLTDFLAAKLTEVSHFKVIPRDQLRTRLKEEKTESYKECYDQSCQIELGKSLAAQKTLATKLIQIGSKCAITSLLYDLKTETTERAASVETDCSIDSLMGSMVEIAKKF